MRGFLLILLIGISLYEAQCQRKVLESKLVSRIVRLFSTVVANIFPPNIKTTPMTNIGNEYDFIVVGSGPGGSAVAARLSEITNWRILVLEAGLSENFIAAIPAYAPVMHWTKYNWKFRMEKQNNVCRAMHDGRCLWPRGKALGGSSVINDMIYTRGNKAAYDRWEMNGNPGWGYDTMLKYFILSEKQQLNQSIIETDYHGNNGSVTTEHLFRSEMTDAVVQAGNGDNIQRDYIGKEQIVFARIQATLNKGRRMTAARAYLKPAMKRPNLDVLTQAFVTKVILDDNNVARGVEYIYKNIEYKVYAKKEVILSGGSLSTPQILMLSGIGPEDQLSKYNIPVKVNNPNVGQNLIDHIMYLGATLMFDKKYEQFLQFFNPLAMVEWMMSGEGELTSLNGITAIGHNKTNEATYEENIPDIEYLISTVGGLMTDFGWFIKEMVGITDKFYKDYISEKDTGSALVIPVLLQPKSRGHLELQSADPRVPPKMYGNYFSDPSDKKSLVAGIKKILELGNTEPLKKMGARLSTKRITECLIYGDLTDEYFSCAVEFLATTIYHQMGTCKMGPPSDITAVVAPNLTVYHTKNLRVIDASVIPESVASHTMGPTYAIGERGADLIKKTYGMPTYFDLIS